MVTMKIWELVKDAANPGRLTWVDAQVTAQWDGQQAWMDAAGGYCMNRPNHHAWLAVPSWQSPSGAAGVGEEVGPGRLPTRYYMNGAIQLEVTAAGGAGGAEEGMPGPMREDLEPRTEARAMERRPAVGKTVPKASPRRTTKPARQAKPAPADRRTARKGAPPARKGAKKSKPGRGPGHWSGA